MKWVGYYRPHDYRRKLKLREITCPRPCIQDRHLGPSDSYLQLGRGVKIWWYKKGLRVHRTCDKCSESSQVHGESWLEEVGAEAVRTWLSNSGVRCPPGQEVGAGHSRPVDFILQPVSESPGGLTITQITGPQPQRFRSSKPWVGIRICVPNQCPGDAVGPATTLWEPWL